MPDLKTAMPLLARHEGIWEGHYRYLDADGKLVDEHDSRLICRLPETGPYPYHQTNIYRWADGRSETRDFPAVLRDGRLHWDSGQVHGWAVEAPEDRHHRTLLLSWLRRDLPDSYLYEMVQISDCGQYRSRMWQWIQAGRVRLRTLIDEELVSRDWQGH